MIVCGTGHRPKYCPCKYNEKHPWLLDLKQRLYADLEIGYSTGQIDTVISGMAIGWDTWLAETALEVGIPVWAYVPFKGQGDRWPTKTKQVYDSILERAEKVKYISEQYSQQSFLKRDREMVDDSGLVLALLNPLADEGGTYYTVRYAQDKNKEIINYWVD